MKYLLPILVMCLIGLDYSASAQSVYTVQNQSDANVRVFAITDSTMADLWVFQESSSANAGGNSGRWYFSNDPHADKKIFFTSNLNDAEVWIYYTSIEANAGWKNTAKTILLN